MFTSYRIKRFLAAVALAALLPGSLSFAQGYLSVLDPQQPWYSYPGTIEEAVLSVRPKGIYMEYGLYLTFSARGAGFTGSDSLEVQFYFNLPEEASVTDSWLWIGDDIIRADIMDQWTASNIYENIVRRRRDPSILFKRGNGAYELRVYPMHRNEKRKVKITYLMPTEWTAQTVASAIPSDLIRSSYNPLKTMRLLVWPDANWRNPRILELPAASLKPAHSDSLGHYAAADLTWDNLQGSLHLAFDSPMQKGVYLSHARYQDEGWYQLALLPSEALNVPNRRKVMVILDYEASKTTVAESELIQAVRTALHTRLAPTDSFNVILSRLDVLRASDKWIPADSASIEATFKAFGPKPLPGYSNLTAALSSGIDFTTAYGSGGSLLLISSSDQVGEAAAANNLIADLKAKTGQLPPIYIIDLANRNYAYYTIGGRTYFGNEYFYTNLARLTGGAHESLRNGATFSQALAQSFGALGGAISSFDMHTTLEHGFSYGRFSSSDNLQALNLDEPILQVGKYYGSFPFVIETSGIYRTTPFSQRITLKEEDAATSDTTLAAFWTGKQIHLLEQGYPGNDIISQIISQSLNYRVLSMYTAFLALEPAQGGEICNTCTDEGETTPIEKDQEAPAPGKGALEAYPNPFTTQTTISAHFAAPVDAADIRIEIYNIMGQLVRTLRLDDFGAISRFELVWDGASDAGQPVASGTYLVVVTTPTQRYTLTVALVR